MSTKILDISSLTIHVPVLEDAASLKRQFSGRIAGNDESLDKAYEFLTPIINQPILVKMALVEAESLVGSLPQEIISLACGAINTSPQSLANPSLAQIGSLSNLFHEEEDVKRILPIIMDKKVVRCLEWSRNSWPSKNSPVFRFHSKDSIHGVGWVMLPFPAQ